MLAVHARALCEFYRQQAQREGIRTGHAGAVTAVQRFGGGLNLNVHFHTLALDGVFVRSPAGRLVFHSASGPSDAEVAQVLATIRRRVGRLLRRRGLEPDADGTDGVDLVAEDSLRRASCAATPAWSRRVSALLSEARSRREAPRSPCRR